MFVTMYQKRRAGGDFPKTRGIFGTAGNTVDQVNTMQGAIMRLNAQRDELRAQLKEAKEEQKTNSNHRGVPVLYKVFSSSPVGVPVVPPIYPVPPHSMYRSI